MTDRMETPKIGGFDNVYFAQIKTDVAPALQMHQRAKLWDANDDWSNVTRHCLLETARVSILAELLGLSPAITQDLQLAAAAHDFFKRGEKKIAIARGLNGENYGLAGRGSTRALQHAGFPERVVRLSNAVGHTTIAETKVFLQKPTLADDDIAHLVMHYVDDYTVDDKPVTPAAEELGRVINDLDRRMDKNNANPRYQKMNEEGFREFGELSYEAQRETGHAVERRLAALLQERAEIVIDPLTLPEFIDGELQKKIAAVE